MLLARGGRNAGGNNAGGFTAQFMAAITATAAFATPATNIRITPQHLPMPVPAIAQNPRIQISLAAPLTTGQCLARIKIRCYSPLQYRAAYDLAPLYRAGLTGKGRTILIIDSFGSPTIASDLTTFDQRWGLPNPPALDIFPEPGMPPFDPNDARMIGWAQETTLDVEYAHAIAPDAKIDLVETSVPETEGAHGFPQIMAAEKYLVDQGKVDVINQSFGATENTFPGFAQRDYRSISNLRFAFQDANKRNVTILSASGDTGATDAQPDGNTLYPFRTNSWPSTDPLVTSVGGTQLFLSTDGTRQSADTAWDDGFGASGGGLSAVFQRPEFQDGVGATVRNHRGTPDISMSAAVDGAAWVYGSFQSATAGWQLFGGTSEATPLFAGIIAIADQLAGRRLGNINAALYALGAQNNRAQTGIVNVPTGSNSFGGITGYPSANGYNLVTGWGTVDAAKFVPALVSFVPEKPILLDLPNVRWPSDTWPH